MYQAIIALLDFDGAMGKIQNQSPKLYATLKRFLDPIPENRPTFDEVLEMALDLKT